MYILGSEL